VAQDGVLDAARVVQQPLRERVQQRVHVRVVAHLGDGLGAEAVRAALLQVLRVEGHDKLGHAVAAGRATGRRFSGAFF